MSGLFTVFNKEVRENLRDRRAAFNSLLLGPILFPFLIIGLSYFGMSEQEEKARAGAGTAGGGYAEYAPNLLRFLEQQQVVIVAEPDDPEGLVQRQEYPAVLRIPAGFPGAVAGRRAGRGGADR